MSSYSSIGSFQRATLWTPPATGKKRCRKARCIWPDLIILDIMMPVMDGYEACRRIKANLETANIPIIMVTALHDRESKLKGLEAGANEFLSKPIDRSELTITGEEPPRRSRQSEDFMLRHNQILEEEVRKRTLELDEAFREIRDMSNEMVRKLTAAAELRDTDTGAHIARIGFYSSRLAEAMDLSADFIEAITFASQVHDIGKIGIPDSILLKPGPLDAGGIRDHEVTHDHRRKDTVQFNLSQHPDGCLHRVEPSRAVGRRRLSARAQGKGNPP